MVGMSSLAEGKVEESGKGSLGAARIWDGRCCEPAARTVCRAGDLSVSAEKGCCAGAEGVGVAAGSDICFRSTKSTQRGLLREEDGRDKRGGTKASKAVCMVSEASRQERSLCSLTGTFLGWAWISRAEVDFFRREHVVIPDHFGGGFCPCFLISFSAASPTFLRFAAASPLMDS